MNNQQYEFNPDKNQKLLEERGVGFEDIIAAIDNGSLLDILPHPNSAKYYNQEIYVVRINDYVYAVPFIRKDKDTIFLKTIFPHRKLTKLYLGGRDE